MIDRLANWVIAAGGKLYPLGTRLRVGSGREVYALQSLQCADLVAEIPERCIVTIRTALRYPNARLVAESWSGDPSDQFWLAVFLLEQRLCGDPWWSPYLETLPDSFQHFPLFFDADTLALLDGSSIPPVIARRRSAYEQDFQHLVSLAPVFQDATLDEYLRARATVMSRAFTVQIDGQTRQALVPFADMFNHSVPSDVDWAFDNTRRAVLMRCTRAVNAGAPVHDSYGKKSNTRLLQNHGFILDDNPDDEATLWISPPRWAADVERRARKFGYADEGRKRFRLPSNWEQEPDVISFLRLACAVDQELEPALSVASGPIPFICARNECQVLETLRHETQNALRRYSSTNDDDEALLTRADLSENARKCVMVRRGEKAVLRSWIQLVSEA